MSKSSNQFEHESLQDNASISAYLQALMQGFENGKIMFSSGNDEIELHPNNLLQFSVKARKKGEKNKISIKVSWKDSKTQNMKDGNIFIHSS